MGRLEVGVAKGQERAEGVRAIWNKQTNEREKQDALDEGQD